MFNLPEFVAKRLSRELKCPTPTFYGYLTAFLLLRRSGRVSEQAVELLPVTPNDKVLEVGFGLGRGLLKLFEKIELGNGSVYGTERSEYLAQRANKLLALELATGKLEIFYTPAVHLPFLDDSFDWIFHNDCFYYFLGAPCLHELSRVLKPEGKMVTALSLERLKWLQSRNLLRGAFFRNPLDYMIALERCGFCDVRFEYHKVGTERFETIFASKSVEQSMRTLEQKENEFFDELIKREKARRSLESSLPVSQVNPTYELLPLLMEVGLAPHIGHLYTSLIADATNRWHKLKATEEQVTLFTTGTDEYGSKVAKAAANAGQSVEDYCNEISQKYKCMHDKFAIETSQFIRTTEERHRRAVHHFWGVLARRGCLYKGNYSGWYCTSDECFYSADELCDSESGKISKQSGHPVTWLSETNYMFRLKQFLPTVKSWLQSSGVIQPEKYLPLLLDQIDILEDISVSRDSKRQPWGIDVPKDASQTIYVWLDALVNYLTVAGYPDQLNRWPPDCHVVGKDILKFHGIFWPAFLLAADLPLPKKVFCHAHWTVDGRKMSKSLKNVVDPIKEADRLTAEGLRYFLLRQGVAHSDGNYSTRLASEVVNDELANGIGNLLGRITSKSLLKNNLFPDYHETVVSECFAEEATLIEKLNRLPDFVAASYDNMNFAQAINAVVTMVKQTNAFVQQNAPWKLVKVEDSQERLNTVLYFAMQALRVASILLTPVVPALSGRILDRLGIEQQHRSFAHCKLMNYPSRCLVGTPLNLDNFEKCFPRVSAE
ncbi:tRNA-synt 1g and Methyltransf 11 domain containin g protein [Trichuris trichiura]|uniref:Methionine--tRNA ligase, mitochondrial n=1 Tax=Trichuris trichiura TaxID=36087 RepID=A0A077Z4C7_TRITR|nr:tRNA-synt 1g and Methyltransf 11 domain containin g protein [Trichuris trichiura]